MHPGDLRIADYTYELPDERIARYPLPERDASRLLIYKNGTIADNAFTQLPDALQAHTLLVFNQTKVVNARLLFRKPSGGMIEIFCLEPDRRYADITTAMAQHGRVHWHCLVGGASKWKHDMVLELQLDAFRLSARIEDRTASDFLIALSWDNEALSFADVLKAAGKIPLPPYLNRDAEASDLERYQTLFARQEGSVAAPTASLHFTPAVIDRLAEKEIDTAMLTLHVGAGTFRQVKSETIGGHDMHEEWLEVDAKALQQITAQLRSGHSMVAVGTTALRTLESLYWMGLKILSRPDMAPEALPVGQWEPYTTTPELPAATAIQALTDWMERNGLPRLVSRTQILIAPGYRFRVVNGLITNFHQPQSTLLLLVAALIGDDWREVYDYALRHDFRFLSYGDSSLLWGRP